MSKGYVYVLSNPSMPGLVKVGWSSNGGQYRADQLYRTGTPMRFLLNFEIFSTAADLLEAAAHQELSHCRVNDGREFFSCPVNKAVECIVHKFLEVHSEAFESDEEVLKPGQRRPFIAPEPELPITEEDRARARATLASLRALISDEVKA